MNPADALIPMLVLLGFLTAALLPFLVVEARWRWRWREVEVGRIPSHAGEPSIYRDAGTVPTFLPRAPRMIRLAGFSCILFGQMFVPGLLMGAFGLIVGGIGLVSIPGLITAAKLYASGLALLRRAPRDAYFKSRNAATWALWLNGSIFAGSVIVAVLWGRGAGKGFWLTWLFINGYGLLSVLQATLLLRVTRRYEDALFAPTATVRLGANLYPLAA